MLFVAFPLLLLIFFICVEFLLVWLKCVLACFSLGLFSMGFSVLLGLDYVFSLIREVFDYNLLKSFLSSFLFLFFFWGGHSNVGAFNIFPAALRRSSILFSLFFFTLFFSSYFHLPVFQLTYSFFCLSYPAIDSF